MPADRHLAASYLFICDAGVVWVEGKTVPFEVPDETAVEKECAAKEAIQSLLHFYIQHGRVAFVNRNVLTVKVGRDLHHEFCETAFQDHGDVLVAVGMKECPGDVEARDVPAFVRVDDGREENRLRRDRRRGRVLFGPITALLAAVGAEPCLNCFIALLF